MKAWLKMRGAEIRTHTKVLAVDAHAASVRIEDDTIIRADRLVVTAGAWTLQLFPSLAKNLMTYRNVGRLSGVTRGSGGSMVECARYRRYWRRQQRLRAAANRRCRPEVRRQCAQITCT